MFSVESPSEEFIFVTVPLEIPRFLSCFLWFLWRLLNSYDCFCPLEVTLDLNLLKIGLIPGEFDTMKRVDVSI